jgi:hypothetical protein
MNTGVFQWSRRDLRQDLKPEELFEAQIEDIRSKRSAFELYSPRQTYTFDNKTLTKVVYVAEKGLGRYLYTWHLIQFPSDPDVLMVSIQSSNPSTWDQDEPILDGIIQSATLRTQP